MKKQIIGTLMLLALSSCNGAKGGSSASNSTYDGPITNLKFNDYSSQTDTDYNHELFYRNDLTLDMGDPMVVYDQGYFYAFGTRGTDRFHCFRSKDLASWERLDDAFIPQAGSWSTYNLWAPDIHKIGGKWYLYYTAAFDYNGTSSCQMGVAVSDNVYGPYIQCPGEDGTIATPPFSLYQDDKSLYATILDPNVFVDDDGSLYMYFSYDMNKSRRQDYSGYNVAEIWGAKMTSPTSWDKSTITRLMSPGFAKLSDSERTIEWETWSPSFAGEMECQEGPYMIKRNGTYYLTYCANSYVDTVYNVGYGTSSSPLGEFVKPNSYELENMILGVPGASGTYINTRYLGFQTGTGHASIVEVGDELMLAYHAHQNRDEWGVDNNYNRALGLDYLYFDGDGHPYANGPTWSINRLPNAVTGYRNLSLEEGVKFTGNGENLPNLIDNFTNRAIRTEEPNRESAFPDSGTVTVKLPEKKAIKFLLINNSYDLNLSLSYIDKVDFGQGRVVTDVVFNKNYYNYDQKWAFPHADFVIELEEEVVTDTITITASKQGGFALGEIEIYGKDAL